MFISAVWSESEPRDLENMHRFEDIQKGHQHMDAKFVAKIDEMIKSSFLVAFAELVHVLAGYIDRVGKWSELCCCHDDLYTSAPTY